MIKSRAIQQLLTVTALAWGAPAQCLEEVVVWSSPPAAGLDLSAPTGQQGVHGWQFSVRARAVAARWVREQPLSTATPVSARRGQVMMAHELLDARTLPAFLAPSLETPPPCVDLLLGNRLVRLERGTRRVVDVGPETG